MKLWLSVLIIAVVIMSIAGIVWSQLRIKQYNKSSNLEGVEKKNERDPQS